ncbi:MAG: helix-turn-helix domain-containing protein [Spirochaetes bacterium]|nr:helix-turn-helix domain-containing protein [Spirochaetota bacterium]MBN2772209.1 helix-turn-helix domain-containing protein [Spirochaetota bacterium]
MKEIFLTLLGLYLIIVPGSALFLVGALLRLRENRYENRLLAMFLFFAAVEILSVFTLQIPGFRLFYNQFWKYAHLLWAPTIYLDVMFLCGIKKDFVIKDLTHGILFLSFLVLQEIIPDIIMDSTLLLQSLAYISIIFFIVYKSQQNSSVTREKRIWALMLSGFSLFFLVLVILDNITDHDFYFFFLIALSLFIITVQFNYASGNPVLSGKNRLKQKTYKNSSLTPQMIAQYAQEIRLAMVEEELFTDADLTLESLSRHLNLPVHHISQSINTIYKKSFSAFINSFRVEHAKKLMQNSDASKTILQIAFESGFGSKSVFNSAFKKETGTTPTQFGKNSLK